MSVPDIKSIFERVSELPGERRAAFLVEACAGDAALRAEINALLVASDAAGDQFMAQPARKQTHPADDDEPFLETLSGSNLVAESRPRVGNSAGGIPGYRILKRLGEGGMGTVFLAEQVEPVRRTVALKLIKPGLAAPEVIARFEAERQALALMEHENIARVYGGGNALNGSPYFVMEYVDGAPLNEYVERKRVPLAARLSLFIQVCEAVHHAHQKGIVHRDLKPTNVLVAENNGRATPKVIDFGVAKAMHVKLTEHTLHTHQGAIIGTLEYMSPEQASLSEQGIDTRSDIYSLGVLLYELLTGTTPLGRERLRNGQLLELLRLIRDEEAIKPSARLAGEAPRPARWIAQVRGELDWIALKALEKDRTRRYDSAASLARDIERYLRDEPIEAIPPSGWYRLQKLARRHWGVFASVCAALLALVAGLGAALWAFSDAAQQRDVARESGLEQFRLRGEADRALTLAREASKRSIEAAKYANDQKEEARLALRRTQLELADREYRDGDDAAALAQLAEVPADLRNQEWAYLHRKGRVLLPPIEARPGAEVDACTAVPTQRGVFAVIGTDGWVSATNVIDGRRLMEFRAEFPMPQERPVFYLACSPDGERLAISRREGAGDAVAIFSLRTGNRLLTLAGERPMYIAFSPDGSRLLELCNRQRVNLWDAKTGALIWSHECKDNHKTCFTSDGNAVVISDGRSALQVFDVRTREVLRELPPASSHITAMAVSPDGKILVTADADSWLRFISLETGAILFAQRLGPSTRISELRFLPGGRRVLSYALLPGGRQSLRLWQVEDGLPLREILGGSHDTRSVEIHPLSGECVVCGPAARAWVLDDMFPSETLRAAPALQAGDFASNDTLFASAPGGELALLDPREPTKPLWTAPGGYRIAEVAADRNCAVVATMERQPEAIVLRRDTEGTFIPGKPFKPEDSTVLMRVSPDGKRLWFTHVLTDLETGERILTPDTTGLTAITDLAWIDDRTMAGLVVAMPRDETSPPHQPEGRIMLWNAATGAPLRSVPLPRPGRALAATANGRLLADGGADLIVRLRDATTLQQIREFRAHDSTINALAFHPAKPILATGSEKDGAVKLWNYESGECLSELYGPIAAVRRLAFSPNGASLVCYSDDRRVHLWNVPAALVFGAELESRVNRRTPILPK